MKKITSISYLLTAGMLLFAAACDTLNPDMDGEDITDEELEIASQIIGESLSDEGGGILSSLYDAVSELDQEGIKYESSQSSLQGVVREDHHGSDERDGHKDRDDHNDHSDRDDHTGRRGKASDYHANYNPVTGEHIVAFRRGFQGELYGQTLMVKSVYIFTDTVGEYLAFPRRHQDQIETIDFKGTREGTASGPFRTSSFTRADELYLDGVSSASSVLTLDGTHRGTGEMSANLLRTESDRIVARSYQVDFELKDISVDKEIVRRSGSLEHGVTGIITYRIKIIRTVDGESRERNLSGVVELTGDGQALLRFDKVQDFFLITLRNGDLKLN